MKIGTLLASLLLILLGVGAQAAHAETGDAEQWFENSAANVARSHAAEALPNLSSDEVASLTVGSPVRAVTFTKAAGSYDQSNLWVAPIMVDDQAVGTVATKFASGASEQDEVTDDAQFATALSAIPDGSQVVVDTKLGASSDLGGWFLVGETVSPLDPVARSVLAGEVSLSQFQEIRADLVGAGVATDKSPAAQTQGTSTIGIVRIVVIVLVILLIVVGVLVWLRRDLSDHQATARREPKSRVSSATDEVKVLKRPERRARREEKTDEDSDD